MNGPTSSEEKVMWQALTWLSYVAIFIICVLSIWLFVQVAAFFKSILIPIAIAGVAAYIFNPLIDLIEFKFKIHRSTAIFLLLGISFLLLIGTLVFIAPKIYVEIINFIDLIPKFIDSVKRDYQIFLSNHPTISTHFKDLHADVQNQLKAGEISLLNSLWTNIHGAFGIIEIFLGLLITPVLFFYFLRDRKSIENNWRDFIPLRSGKTKNEIIAVLEDINRYMQVFFRGQIIVAICIGVLNALGLYAIGLNYGIIIGLIAGFLSIIPYLGVIISIIPSMVLAYFQPEGGLSLMLMTAGVFMVVQAIEGMFISPKIMGDQTGLHPATVIISILAWSILLGGPLGALLAIPLTATLKVLMYRYIWKLPAE